MALPASLAGAKTVTVPLNTVNFVPLLTDLPRLLIQRVEVSLYTRSVFKEEIKSVPALTSIPIHEPELTAMERILVIEDDRAVQKALRRLFESEGYSVDVATNGSTGLEIFARRPPCACPRLDITRHVRA